MRAVRSVTRRRTGSRLLGLDELEPELVDGLRVDLAHPRLGHTEDVADLGERQPSK
jgi:hypothetical protein